MGSHFTVTYDPACPRVELFVNVISIFSIPAPQYSHPVPWTWHSSISLFFIIYFPMEIYLTVTKGRRLTGKFHFWQNSNFMRNFRKCENIDFCLHFSIFKIIFFFIQSSFSFPLPTLITTSSQLFLHMLARERTMFRYFFPNLPFSTV